MSKKDIAESLLKIGAVFLRPEKPFIWASGIKSPIYCDNRLILTAPEVREEIEKELVVLIKEKYPEVELLMGTSTAGIAHAAICGHLTGLPMGYVRSGSKDHGRNNKIEGKLVGGEKTVVIEDLISTGGSVIEVVETLREAGAEVLGVVSIMTYGMKKAQENFEAAQTKYFSLTDFDAVCEAAAEKGIIKQSSIDALKKFRDDPSDESWIGNT